MEKQNLFGLTLSELSAITGELGMPSYSARQIAEWLYSKEITEIDEMTNISLLNRNLLKEHYHIELKLPTRVQESVDGTKKYLFPALSSKFIETAYIPEESRATLCVSTQVGCKMGCVFCMTGHQGFQGNLSAGDILNQVRSLPERKQVTNIVFMGMGEPMDNIDEVMKSLEILTSEWGFAFSPRRITVSTIGIIPGMKTFVEKSQCHLAISIHSPFDQERKKLMPVENVHPLKKVIQYLKQFDWTRQRRISAEYIMFKDINDTGAHLNGLVKLLSGLHCRVNLIRFHSLPGSSMQSSDHDTMIAFRDGLNAHGIIATIRKSRGEDIMAACGLLSTKEMI